MLKLANKKIFIFNFLLKKYYYYLKCFEINVINLFGINAI